MQEIQTGERAEYRGESAEFFCNKRKEIIIGEKLQEKTLLLNRSLRLSLIKLVPEFVEYFYFRRNDRSRKVAVFQRDSFQNHLASPQRRINNFMNPYPAFYIAFDSQEDLFKPLVPENHEHVCPISLSANPPNACRALLFMNR
jgi:hypothetical protein